MAKLLAPKYIPTPEEIEAAKAEIDARRLEQWDRSHPQSEAARERARLRVRARRARLKLESANCTLQECDLSLQLDRAALIDAFTADALGLREMTARDIANVEFIDSRDLDEVFDSLIEAVSFQYDLEDCECRWNIADVDADMMDLSDPPATLTVHDELSLDADERGVPAVALREMTPDDICNIDITSLLALNLVPEKLSDRLALGSIDPETMDLGADSLAALQEATYQRIAFKLKTEIQTQRDVQAFRSKRR